VEYRRLGRAGVKVSAIGLGTWLTFGGRLDDRAATAIVRRALDLGVVLFDTADVYEGGRAEEALARALDGVPRSSYVLATKCYFPTGPGPNDRGLSRKHVDESCHASLRRLRTTYLDLFQCHRFDPETPIEETVRAMDDLIRQGKVLYWGVSCWSAAQIDEAMAVARRLGASAPVSEQPPYNLLQRGVEAEVVPACGKHGLGVLAFSPLAQGVLAGKYAPGTSPEGARGTDPIRNRWMQPYLEPEKLARVEGLRRLASEAGVPPARLALAWVLARPQVASALVGATSVAQLEENVKAVSVRPDPDLLARLDAIFPA
jgi:voltage-dependent potassium channel beta subunit